jgi:hypothetical protein
LSSRLQCTLKRPIAARSHRLPSQALPRNLLQSPTGVADPRGMKPLLGNAAANSLTCHVREADANLLSLLPQSSPHLPANHSIQVHSTPCFLSDRLGLGLFKHSRQNTPSASHRIFTTQSKFDN